MFEANIRGSSERVAESRNVRQVINIGHFNRRERCKDKCSMFLSSHATKIIFEQPLILSRLKM